MASSRKRCTRDGCQDKATVAIKDGEVCYIHYNEAVRQGRAQGARMTRLFR